MANASQLVEGETIHFKFGPNGELLIVRPDEMGLDRGILGRAVIDHIDVETKTIYFTTPLPKKVRQCRINP